MHGAAHGVWNDRTRRVDGEAEFKVDLNSCSEVISLSVDMLMIGCPGEQRSVVSGPVWVKLYNSSYGVYN